MHAVQDDPPVLSSHTTPTPLHLQILDMGEYALKGVAKPQAVVGLQLARLASGQASSHVVGGKAKCVRPGTGLMETVQVLLPFPVQPPGVGLASWTVSLQEEAAGAAAMA